MTTFLNTDTDDSVDTICMLVLADALIRSIVFTDEDYYNVEVLKLRAAKMLRRAAKELTLERARER